MNDNSYYIGLIYKHLNTNYFNNKKSYTLGPLYYIKLNYGYFSIFRWNVYQLTQLFEIHHD